MEKQRKNRKIKFNNGLLKIYILAGLLFIFGHDTFAQRLTFSMIRELRVVAVNQNNFSDNDCAFELKIPYIKAENVQAQIPDLPNGVNFVSLRRSEYSDSETGTKIELWLNFSEAGVHRLKFLKVYLNNSWYGIPFEPITILENPRNILPQLVVSFDDGTEFVQTRKGPQKTKKRFSTKAGVPVIFTVYLQYGVQIVSFNYSVPKNAIFRELERYDITRGTLRSSEFTEEKIPVAQFEWEPLYRGDQYLPDLHIVATSYNGVRVDLKLPEIPINVLENVFESETENDGEELFGYAFSKKVTPSKKTEKAPISIENCEKIAQLRTAERHSIPFTAEYRERKEFERSLDITESSFEPTYFLVKLSLIIFAFFLLLLLAMIFLKKLHGIIVFSVFTIFFLVELIITSVVITTPYAIFKGGEVRPVPELISSESASIESGKRVRVEQRTGGWVFVHFGNSGGWVTEDRIVFIDK